ncbi:unnamed protein product [Bursaphelenchus xylophilus]|uniref:[histone H3]-lysine(27) N-trimethyltransferase n=1 Tax=Bursaphelenchus xylophilus TaxID=6326 RepID=A0A1I7SVH1_BURXY|nr:unnamed protein product [Bursaphelenchus xylophilus]CAG9101444.1 unnamed protein product [Bursaphelenchus xylophilus]
MSSTSSSSGARRPIARRVGRPPINPVSSANSTTTTRTGKTRSESSVETSSTEVSRSSTPRPRKRLRNGPTLIKSPPKKRGRPRQRKRLAKEPIRLFEEEEEVDEEDDVESVDSMEGMDPSWEPAILKAYWRAREAFERILATEATSALDDAVECKRKWSRGTFDNKPLPKFHIPRNEKKKLTAIYMEKIEPLPPMVFWTLTEMNIRAEDEYTLSHVPYMGDDIDEHELTQELMECFPDGIHGTRVGCGEYTNDFILYYTVKYSVESINDIPYNKLLRLIYELFPNKCQKNELEEVYPDLRARFEKHLIRDPMPCDENGLQKNNVTPESLLHSYQVLQCYKCTLYDCPHHSGHFLDETAQASVIRRRDDRNFHYTPEPCNGQCYLSKRASLSPDKRTNHRQLKINTKQVSWSPHEESMMALIKSVGITDCCLIARALQIEPGQQPKTCNDVYEYFRRQSPISPTINVVRETVKRKRSEIHRKFRAMKWSADGEVKNKYAYIPCSHDGPCTEETCSCYSRDKICTKYCKCFHNECKIQFPGCRCNPGNCRTRQCPCYYASWECDPDLCKNCRCEPDDQGLPNEKCKNICFQRGLQKKLSVRPSQVAGWGCFADEPMNRHDFISEYCGEIVSVAESERRGKIYDKTKCSYLFELNQDFQVDATRKGNLIRFANHSSNPNCYAKVVVVNTDHRIGIFASRFIEKGEELFFDYAYSKNHQLAFLSKELDKNHQVVTMTEKTLKDKKKKKQ